MACLRPPSYWAVLHWEHSEYLRPMRSHINTRVVLVTSHSLPTGWAINQRSSTRRSRKPGSHFRVWIISCHFMKIHVNAMRKPGQLGTSVIRGLASSGVLEQTSPSFLDLYFWIWPVGKVMYDWYWSKQHIMTTKNTSNVGGLKGDPFIMKQ